MSLILVAVGAGQLERANCAFETMRGLSPAYAHRALTQDAPMRKPEDRRRFTLATRIAAGRFLNDWGTAVGRKLAMPLKVLEADYTATGCAILKQSLNVAK